MTIVIRTIARLIIPFEIIFGLYLIIHGTISPGGGFQGGLLIGASMIFYAIVFGMPEAEGRIAPRIKLIASCAGILMFTLIGLAGVALGGYFLDYFVFPLPYDPSVVNKIMISVIEGAIGLTVMGVHIAIFYYMTGEAK